MSAPGQPHTATEFTSFCTSKLKWYGRTTTKKGGSISRGEENPEITQRSWSQRSRTKKCYQKSTKDMLRFSSKSFSSSFFSPKIIYFFFPPNTMDLPVEFPGRQRNRALQQHCSQSNHAYAVQAIHSTLSLQKDIDLQCRAAQKHREWKPNS